MEPTVNVGSLRSVVTRAGVGLGLIVFLVISPGGFPTVVPVAAQNATPEGDQEETPTPEATRMPAAGPVFKPSGTGSAGAPKPDSPPSQGAPAASGVPAPPAVGAGVFQDGLKNDRIFRPGKCPTLSAGGDLVPDGFRLVVVGPCTDDAGVADVSVPARGITVGDGDVAMDFMVADGAELATLSVYVRNRDRKLVGASVNPVLGQATLFQSINGEEETLASRSDLGEMVNPGEWNRLAVRVSGNEMWLLLNDQPALYASRVVDEPGDVGIRLVREGRRITDESGTVVVFRDLTLSALEGADPARGPTYPGR
jgi:hypothetical protein